MEVDEAQNRLRRIARALSGGKAMQEVDRVFLITALNAIADGKNADAILEVKGQKGKRKGAAASQRQGIKRFAMAWIAAAKAPIENGGLGLTLEQATGLIGENGAKNFGLTEESLKTYWNNSPDMHGVVIADPKKDRKD